jgi:hypothetical protein
MEGSALCALWTLKHRIESPGSTSSLMLALNFNDGAINIWAARITLT